MSSSLDTIMDGEVRYQQLLAAKARIDAELASFPPQSTPYCPSLPQHRAQKQPSRQSQGRKDVPRSITGPSMSRHLSYDRIEPQQTQMSRSLSQKSAPSMTRRNSRGNKSQGSNLPFTSTGRVPTPLVDHRRDNISMTAWISQQEQASNEYTFSSQTPSLKRSASRKSELANIGEDPSEFLTRYGLPTITLPSTPNTHRHSVSPQTMHSPVTPATAPLTDAPTLASEMSRQNSLFNEPLVESVQMMKVNSSVSCSPSVNFDQFSHDDFSAVATTCFFTSEEEQSKLLVGAGASHESLFSQSFQIPSSFPMVQSLSSSSSSSSKSSRNVQRLQDQNLAAARPIMPKGRLDETFMSREHSSQSMTRQESRDKVAIPSKSTYQRPKHDKVHCTQCENHPEGFRGEHELRRHVDREHKKLVKKWICVVPTDGLSHPQPVNSLLKCKSCHQQRKKYGAYYNAAAHLRRAHFAPKPFRRSKSKGVSRAEEEKRGGKGGGDWPPMDELKKYWMKEVEETVEIAQHDSMEDQREVGDASDDESTLNRTYEGGMYSQSNTSISGRSPYDPIDSRHHTSLTTNSYLSSTIDDHQPYPSFNNEIFDMNMSSFDINITNFHDPNMDSPGYGSATQHQPFSVVEYQPDQLMSQDLYLNTDVSQSIRDQSFSWS